MSAKIYSGIKGINPPKFDFKNYGEYQKKCDEYIKLLEEQCKAASNHKNAGKIISFPVADGRAQYMICTMKPLQLIHINTGDGYQTEFAQLLTAKKVNEMIERDEKFNELFNKKK